MTKSIQPKNIVLYADDDPDDLMLVIEAFRNYSDRVEIITVNDGVEALSWLKNLSDFDPRPCLVILDVNMPRLNGKETLVQIRSIERFTDLPVVLFTTSSLPPDHAFARRYKAGFITKPIDARQMERITDEFIEHCTDEIKKNIGRKMNG